MAHVHHFEYGWLTPGLAYGVSVLGSLLGLLCAARARGVVGSRLRRIGWMATAAVAIGGTGIWLMHFMAMIGFSVVGSDIRFRPGLTALSAVLAIGVVWLGLIILGTGEVKWYRVLAGGIVAGLGVAAMHYSGMAAMQIDGSLGYQPLLVLASVAIAVTAASVALWFTVVARSTVVIIGAALIMGVAVTGMHYVGMAAARITLDPVRGALGGVDVATALPPIAAIAGLVVVVLLYMALSAPEEDSRYFVPEPADEQHVAPVVTPGRQNDQEPARAGSRPLGFQPLNGTARHAPAPASAQPPSSDASPWGAPLGPAPAQHGPAARRQTARP